MVTGMPAAERTVSVVRLAAGMIRVNFTSGNAGEGCVENGRSALAARGILTPRADLFNVTRKAAQSMNPVLQTWSRGFLFMSPDYFNKAGGRHGV